MYNAVQQRATQNVMITHVESNRFGLLLKEARERLGLRQEDVGDALGIHRTMVNKWENGNFKRPLSIDDIDKLHKLTRIPVVIWIEALGYDVRLDEKEMEAGAALLGAFLKAGDVPRQITQLALGLGDPLPRDGLLGSLRRLSETDRQDR